MHVTYTDKSLLLGDEIASLLIEYAAALGDRGKADSVTVQAISADGNEVQAMFLLSGGAALMAETAHTSLPEPDDARIAAHVRDRLDRLLTIDDVVAAEPTEDMVYPADYEDLSYSS